MADVQTFSEGKPEERNEDFFGYNTNCFVIADGATDKSGKAYNGKTGGEIISRLVVNESLSINLNGVELINHLNKKIYELYSQLKILEDIKDPKYRFTCGGFICVRLIDNEIIITYLGDSGFRINGTEVYQEKKQIDINNSEKRSEYIQKTNDINGSREQMMPLILKQFDYQNNPNDSLGFGVIDGTDTPVKFIKIFKYNKDKIKTIELFTDGYLDIPQEVSIKAWEAIFERIKLEDPYKYKKYKSTGSKVDRTIVIIEF